MTTDRSAHQPIEKQVEEAFACTDNCRVDFPDLDCHWSSCAAYHRPAVLALLERRESEHAAALKFCRDMALSAQKKAREYHERREQEQEHATLLEALIHLTNETLASTGMAEHELREVLGNTNFNCLVRRATEAKALIAKVEGTAPELGPCGRHGKEFWVSAEQEGATLPICTAEAMRPDRQILYTGHCTACAQEKAAPGGVK